jgi:hypothetical protein
MREVVSCEIFISAKTTDAHGNPTPDVGLAREVHDYLTSRGHTVFLSGLWLEKFGIDAYKNTIDDALDAARVLIAVGTSAENLESRWVRYEWDSFVNDVLSGVKPDGHIFVYAHGIAMNRLPRALRQRQVFFHGPNSLVELGNFVRNALGSAVSRPESSLARSPTNGELNRGAREVEIAVVNAGCSHLGALTAAVDRANFTQSMFRYFLLEDALADAIRLATYRDINAPDFFNAIEESRKSLGNERPFVIVVTDSSVSGKTLGNLFGSHRARQGLAVITTRLVPDIIVPAGSMAAYFLYYLARYTLNFLFPRIRNHDEPRNCVFDRKLRKADLLQSMATRSLCDQCRRQLLTTGGVGAATRIQALDRLFALSGDILKTEPGETGEP